jgi:hypothetical protein
MDEIPNSIEATGRGSDSHWETESLCPGFTFRVTFVHLRMLPRS